MNNEILRSRYEFKPDGKAVIDICVDDIGDLFNSFDKKAVFSRRDLDEDFVEYLTDCVRELGSNSFLVHINIEKGFDRVREEALRKSITNQFTYLYGIEHRKIQNEFKKFFFLLILGCVLGFIFYYINIPDLPTTPVWQKVCSEGGIIAVWVAFWEAMDSLIFGFTPYWTNRKIYHKLIVSEYVITGSSV